MKSQRSIPKQRRKPNQRSKQNESRIRHSDTSDKLAITYFMPISVPRQAPPSMRVKMNYNTSLELANGTDVFTSTYRLLSGLYDPDDGGSANDRNYTGFNQWLEIYGRYLVEKVYYRVTINNSQTIPLVFCLAPSTYDLTSQLTSGNAIANLAELPFGRKVQLAAQGGIDSKVITGSIDIGELHGDMRVYTGDDYYRGTTTANPLIYSYIYFGCFASANLDQGCTVSVELTAQVFLDQRRVHLNDQTIPPSLVTSRILGPTARPG